MRLGRRAYALVECHPGADTSATIPLFLLSCTGERILLVVAQHLARARRAALRTEATITRSARAEADDRAVDGATAASIIPILRPVLADSASRLAHVFEVGTAQVFVLLNVEPEVQDVFGSFALEEKAGKRRQLVSFTMIISA